MEGMCKNVMYIVSQIRNNYFRNRYAIAVLPDHYRQNDKINFKRLLEELTSAGYKVQDTTVGDEGFKVQVLDDK